MILAGSLRRRSPRPAGAAFQKEHCGFEARHIALNGRAARRFCTQRCAEQHAADHCCDQGLAGVDLDSEGAPQGRLGYGSAGLRINNNPADERLRDRSTRQTLDNVALILGSNKFLAPGATSYGRHFGPLVIE